MSKNIIFRDLLSVFDMMSTVKGQKGQRQRLRDSRSKFKVIKVKVKVINIKVKGQKGPQTKADGLTTTSSCFICVFFYL